jgi:hypothetical protein
MADSLERALHSKGYSSLPLPRASNGPTTIFGFEKGKPFVVRNAQRCLPDPPITVTRDQAVDTITLQQSFSVGVSGLARFLGTLLGGTKADGQFEAKGIAMASVRMSGLEHQTVQTGAMLDYLAGGIDQACAPDLFDPKNLIVIACLRASTFTYDFKNEKGLAVKLNAEDATAMFKASADVAITMTESGAVAVTWPSYVGWIMWSGKALRDAVRRRKALPLATVLGVEKDPLDIERAIGEQALSPAEVEEMRLTSV